MQRSDGSCPVGAGGDARAAVGASPCATAAYGGPAASSAAAAAAVGVGRLPSAASG